MDNYPERDLNPPEGIVLSTGLKAYHKLPAKVTHKAMQKQLEEIAGYKNGQSFTYFDQLIETWEVGGDIDDVLNQMAADVVETDDECLTTLADIEAYE